MKVSKKLIAKIKDFEGCKLYAYRCPAGVATIGYGSTRNVKMGMAITQIRAEARLINDITMCEEQIAKLKLPKLSTPKWDAIVDFVFNLGIDKFQSSTLCKYIKEGRSDEEIQAQFRRWVYSKGQKLQGLVKRREWEAKRWIEKE